MKRCSKTYIKYVIGYKDEQKVIFTLENSDFIRAEDHRVKRNPEKIKEFSGLCINQHFDKSYPGELKVKNKNL
jgi:hypothetical protein